MMLSNEHEAREALATACYYNNKSYTDRLKCIHWYWTDSADEPIYAWIAEYDNGTFAYIEGWHDYTGWDCRSGIDIHTADSLEQAKRLVPEHIRNTESGACYVRCT